MKSRVLFLVHLPPPVMGPSLINREILNSRLLHEKFDIDVLPINTSSSISSVERFSFKKLPVLAGKIFKLIGKLSGNKYEFAYFTLSVAGIGFLKDFLLVLILKLSGTKIIYHLHGKGISKSKNLFIKSCYRFCFKNEKVILLSELLSADIKDYVKSSALDILPNGMQNVISDKEFNLLSEKRQETQEQTRLLFLANMVRSKGVFTALEAAKILKSKGFNFDFYFAGDWFDISKEEFFDKVKGLGLEKNIKFLGFKARQEKYRLFSECDVFIFPTTKDTFPLVLIEAMQFGLPVISTSEGAIPEMIEDGVNGYLVPGKNPEKLAEKIITLIEDKNLRLKMGIAAREKFLNNYTFEKFQSGLMDIFLAQNKELKCAG